MLFQRTPLVAFVLTAGLASFASAAEPKLEQTDLFTHPDAARGYNTYHIPGLAVTKQGTVLAYCEARKGGGGDWAHIDVVLRRSTDGGRTFDEPRHIAHLGKFVPRTELALKRSPQSKDFQTVNNPVAIVDHQTGAIHFVYCVNYAHCFYIRSDDDGVTFTPPVEITSAFEAFRSVYPWTVLATGPNHGIQTRGGRLVVPVWLSTGTGEGGHRPSVTSVIYSDDHGKSWHAGEIAVPCTDEFVNPNETVVVELADGSVMLNVRNESPAARRIVVTSPNGATQWSTPKFDDALLEPICMGAIVRLSTTATSDKNRLVYAAPHGLPSTVGKVTLADRKNISVKLSYDEGRTWPVNRVLEAGPSGYSDLAVLPDGTMLCLYGRSEKEGRDMYRDGSLRLARFNLEWLTEGKDTLGK
ncbi:MAG: sialidase family protein [Pirellulales bacterium]